jgi:hypothetical protein
MKDNTNPPVGHGHPPDTVAQAFSAPDGTKVPKRAPRYRPRQLLTFLAARALREVCGGLTIDWLSEMDDVSAETFRQYMIGERPAPMRILLVLDDVEFERMITAIRKLRSGLRVVLVRDGKTHR